MGSPLRVLHVVVNMNRGGAETLLMNLYRNINREKVQFDFLTCKEGVFDAEIEKLGGKIHRVPYISEVGHFGYIKVLNNFFTENNYYKIVHSHMDKMSGLVLREANHAGIPIRISHSHSTKSEGDFLARCYKWYVGNHINSNATNLIACSSEAAKWLFFRNSSKSIILKNGIEFNKFKFSQKKRIKARKKLNIDNDALVVGHVGRFSTPKNHKFLIEIFNEINKTHQNILLILVGHGPLLPEIKNKVLEYDLTDKVKFLGVRSDIDDLLNAFDLFMFPSLYEGLPVTVVEAQASGLPCFISDSISKEVDLGLNKVEFISLSNKSDWIEKVNKYNRNISREFSSNILNKVGYDIEQTTQQLQKFYSTVLR